jgi:uncharacterized membrane protein YqhA
MKLIYSSVRVFILIIALIVFASGIVLTVIGAFDFAKVFSLIGTSEHNDVRGLMAIALLHAVDIFLIAIVFFVLAFGMLILFGNPESKFPLTLPEWLHVQNFMELKAILWEAILTTLVVTYLAGLAERAIEGKEIEIQSLLIPGGILLIAVSLFFLKRAEK